MGEQQGARTNDFYVGYMPVPASHRRVLWIAVPAALLAALGVAVIVGASQRDPGAAEWREREETFRGTLLTDPYPLVLTREGGVVLLVEQGKHGARERARELSGGAVVAKGRVLTRDGRTVLELVDGADSLTADTAPLGPVASSGPSDRITVTGEIIDSKCYHGAMKPGEGKTHKACATLCISNGIPAMFIDETGKAYLLSAGGTVLDDDSLSKIGERVEVTGDVTALGDLPVLRIAPGTVRRVRSK